MRDPIVSVVLNTARSNFPMIGLQETNHLFYTIDALKRQTYTDFELIISDYIHKDREIDWSECPGVNFPVYHVPISHSWAHSNGYCAISAGKNNGVMNSSGRYIIFLDDCCTFEKDFIFRIWKNWAQRKLFTNALHRKIVGTIDFTDENGKQIIDCRYEYFKDGSNERVNNFHMYGYSSMSMEAILKINGFDEMFDGSRQLEDIECGERLKLNGFNLLLSKLVFVNEQEHLEVGRGPERNDCPWHTSKGNDIKLNPNLRCNGIYFYLKTLRPLEQRMLANCHVLTVDEKNKIKPCCMLEGKMCKMSGLECNWIDENGRLKYMDVEDFIYNNPPIFNLREMRESCLLTKENYRVI